MAFYGRSFIYDGVPSETYGLYISDIDANAVNQSMGSTSVEIREQKVYRRATPYFYGATPNTKLSFTFSAFSEQEIDASLYQLIQKWLFSSRSYKTFQIDQPDIQDIYFNAILNDPKTNRVGNLIQGFTCDVVCDSPYAFKFPKTTTYTYTASDVDDTQVYYNESDDRYSYLYPSSLVVTMNNVGSEFSITNETDSDRVVSFTGLSASEVLTISPSLQTISSSTGLTRLSNSNKKFLRLLSGENSLRFQGNISSIAMTNQWIAKKIGG
jgi:phage-related protein